MSQANFAPYMECSLALAEDLVNTAHEGHDHLQDVASLRAFAEEHNLTGPRATASDLEEVRELRSRLTSVWTAADEESAARILNALLKSSGANPVLTNHEDDQPWHLHYTPPGAPLAPRLTAECAMALAVVIAEGGFERLRRCASETCDDVFVDASRNRSRRYCSPSVCGNRASVRAFRERQKAERDAG
jgi:predicted RNA-binding Zn ribbon-like protein